MRYINKIIETDVLVVGGGLAGCWAAIEAARTLNGKGSVILADKGKVGKSGQSPFAAGIFTVFDPEEDELEQWMEEIIRFGEYINDQEWCKKLFLESMPIFKEMDGWAEQLGETFVEKDENGRYMRRRGRGHHYTRHNVINALPMMKILQKPLKEFGVQIINRLMITDLVMQDGKPVGAVGIHYRDNNVYFIKAKTIVLAASGSGFKSVFICHQNLTGDLQAAAFEAGVELRNMEQYATNTCSKEHDVHGMVLFVGIGGKFLNRNDEEFMWKYNPILGNRARLQDLALSFCREYLEGRGPIRLDLSAASEADRELCRKILPETFTLWDRAGIDGFAQPIEWIPGSYATLISGGGIHINTKCETNVPYLYAAGDITCEPPHGTYSFGGVNLAFAAVSGKEAGKNAAMASMERGAGVFGNNGSLKEEAERLVKMTMQPMNTEAKVEPEAIIKRIQEVIIPVNVGYIKSKASLQNAFEKIKQLEQEDLSLLGAKSAHELMRAIEVRSMAKVAKTMVASSLVRKESRGWHFREDFPQTDNVNWLKWIFISKDAASESGVKTFTRDVRPEQYGPTEDYETPPGVRRL